jgi:hypothetical protein
VDSKIFLREATVDQVWSLLTSILNAGMDLKRSGFSGSEALAIRIKGERGNQSGEEMLMKRLRVFERILKASVVRKL